MKTEGKNQNISVIVSENATPKQRRLADWLVSALAELDVEAEVVQDPVIEAASAKEQGEQNVADEGKPRTPLPDREKTSSCEESEEPHMTHKESAAQEDGEDDWLVDLEPSDEREVAREHTKGFLIGVFTAWLVAGAGALLLRLTRSGLRWLAGLTDIPFDALVGLVLLTVLALFFKRKTQRLTDRLIDWFDFDF